MGLIVIASLYNRWQNCQDTWIGGGFGFAYWWDYAFESLAWTRKTKLIFISLVKLCISLLKVKRSQFSLKWQEKLRHIHATSTGQVMVKFHSCQQILPSFPPSFCPLPPCRHPFIYEIRGDIPAGALRMTAQWYVIYCMPLEYSGRTFTREHWKWQ